jgi:hypothetical protein
MMSVPNLPDADLLEKMADANVHTAIYIEQGGNPPGPVPSHIVSGMLHMIAVAQRKIAKDIREGRGVRERVSTDG